MFVVTAAGGRTGTAVVRALRERGAEVRAVVSRRDVADAAAVLLTEDGLDAGTFEAAGPEPLTVLLGRPPRTYAEHLRSTG